MTVVSEISKLLTEQLQLAANPSDGVKMAAYMKDQFPFYGVKAPARKSIVNPIWRDLKKDVRTNIRPLVTHLWQLPEREYQMVAMELLGKCQKDLTPEDLAWVEGLVTNKSWWDTVDYLATNTVGAILKEDKALAQKTANQFYKTGNLWLQRTAIIFQLKYKDEVDESLLYNLITKSLSNPEFFIRKACGWALRQYSKYNPISVKTYIEDNRSKMSSLTLREGTKYL